MSSIPIIYTGKEVAAPDWKFFNQNFNARMAQLSQQRQQQRQFEALQQERMTKEFLKEIDIDQYNFATNNLKTQQNRIVEGVTDYAVGLLKDKQGDLSTEDFLKVRMVAGSAQQDIQKMSNWEKARNADATAAASKIGVLYDPDKVKKNILSWDGSTPYTESRLSDSLIDIPIEDVALKIKADIKNPNKASLTSEISGLNVTNEETWNANFVTPSIDQNGKIDYSPIYGNQISYIRTALSTGEDWINKVRSVEANYNTKTSQDEQQYYEQLAINAGRDKEDAKYLWVADEYNIFGVQKGNIKTKPVTDEKSKNGKDKRTVVDVTSGQGQFGDKSIVSSGTKTYFNKEGEKKTGTFRKGDLVYTDIEWSENPETGDSEWMVKGYIPKAGEIDIPEDASESELVRAILQASAIKGDRAVEEVRIPYESIKEEMDRNYRLEGIDDFEPPTTTYIYDGAEFSQDEIKQAADALNMSIDAYIKKYKIKTK